MSLILIMLLTLIFYIVLFSLFWDIFQIWTKYEIVTWLLDHKDVVYSLSQVFLFLITEQATLKQAVLFKHLPVYSAFGMQSEEWCSVNFFISCRSPWRLAI